MGWIRSKPVYVTLAPVAGAARHVGASEGGAGARAVGRALPAAPEAAAMHLHTGSGAPTGAIALRSADFLYARLRAELAASPAGTVLSVAGSERFVWRCARVAREAGLSREHVRAELAGSAARDVYCVHCKAITPGVKTSIVPCAGCGQPLFVRDHFSRLLVAYAGVRVDAETPGEVPAPEELYA